MTITATSIDLTWNAPVSGGAPDVYTLASRVTGSGPFSIVTDSISNTATAYSAGGLIPTTSYDFMLYATNSAGPGGGAVTTQATLGKVPNAPSSLSAGAGSPAYSVAALSWTAPSTDSTHGPASSYTVSYRLNNTGSWIVFASGVTGTAESVTGLSHDALYGFKVDALNSAGTDVSGATTTLTTDYAPPNVPTGIAVAPVDDGTTSKLTATWTASAVDGTHDAAASYNLRWSVSGAGSWTTLTGVTSGDVITGLTAGTAYDVEIEAANASSTSPSAWSGIVTASTYSLVITWGNLAPSTPVSHTGSWPSGGLNFVAGSTPPSGTVGQIAYQASASPVPTSGFVGPIAGGTAGSTYGADGFGEYLSPPSTAGTWYVFAVLQNGSGVTIGALVSGAITVT